MGSRRNFEFTRGFVAVTTQTKPWAPFLQVRPVAQGTQCVNSAGARWVIPWHRYDLATTDERLIKIFLLWTYKCKNNFEWPYTSANGWLPTTKPLLPRMTPVPELQKTNLARPGLQGNMPGTLKPPSVFLMARQRDFLSCRTSHCFIRLVSDNLLHPNSRSFVFSRSCENSSGAVATVKDRIYKRSAMPLVTTVTGHPQAPPVDE